MNHLWRNLLSSKQTSQEISEENLLDTMTEFDFVQHKAVPVKSIFDANVIVEMLEGAFNFEEICCCSIEKNLGNPWALNV